MNWAWHISFSLLAFVLGSCAKQPGPDCISTLQNIVTDARSLPTFEKLDIQGRIDLRLTQDSTNFAKVTYGQSLLDGIETKVHDGTLFINEVNGCDWVRNQNTRPVIELHYKSVEQIENQCSGTVYFENANTSTHLEMNVYDVSGSARINFDGDSLRILNHTGATDVVALGVAKYLYVYNAGFAPIDASRLLVDVCHPHSQSTGLTKVNASVRLSYQIFDRGDIEVYGNPAIIEAWHDKGSGKLILID